MSVPGEGLMYDFSAQEGRCRRYCCFCCFGVSTVAIYLCFSILTMVIGVSLFVVSSRQNRPVSLLGPQDFDVEDMGAYWLQLREWVVTTPDTIIIPATPVYKALQWMVLHDPLRPLQDEARVRQRYTLALLFFLWNGPNWGLPEHSGWLLQATQHKTLVHECSWEGIRCNQDNQVVALELDNDLFAIKGARIPPQLGDLTALQDLALVGHDLEGAIPSELGRLTGIQTIDLSFNRLTSLDLLASVDARQLTLFRLSSNQIHGFVDMSTLAQSTNLKVLEINSNEQLEGDLFPYLTNLTQLESLDISWTLVNGPILSDVGKLTNLKTLNLGSTMVSPLPTSIGQCNKLEVLRVIPPPGTMAGLDGELPTEIGLLTNLKILDIRSNRMLGSTLPTELGKLTLLNELAFKSCNLSGSLPTEIGNLSNLESLYLDDNSITGTVPSEYGKLTNLFRMELQETMIHGTMPQEVCDININVLLASCKDFPGITPDTGTFACDCCFCDV